MKNFDIGYSWMPAAHDAYPGWDYVSVIKNLPVKGITETRGPTFYMLRRGSRAYISYVKGSPAEAKASQGQIIFDRSEQERKHCTHIMFNASEAPRRPKGVRHEKRMAFKKEFVILQDSGGYQLVSGVKQFVDPHAVAAAHNLYAHEGVGLDIPTGSLSNVDLLIESSKIQNLNNKLILRDLDKKVQLFATSQGTSPEGRERYLDVMLDSEFSGVTIAGLRPILGIYAPTPVQLMLHLLYVVLRTRDRTNRFHVLGVSTFSTILMLAAAAEHLQVRITSDSARHILSGAGGSTLSNPNLQVLQSGAGTRQSGGALGKKGGYMSQCTCRICSTLMFDNMYSDSRFLQTHSLNSLMMSSVHVREEAKMILAAGPCGTQGQNFARAIELLKTVKTAKEAMKLLRKETAAVRARPTLFKSASFGDKSMSINDLEKQMLAVIERYKKFHKTGKIDPDWIKEKK